MSYRILADELQRAAESIRAHEGGLEGLKLAAAAEKVIKDLKKFDVLLKDALRGKNPANALLHDLLAMEASQRALDEKLLKLLAKKCTGKALSLKKDDTPEDRRRRFLEAMVKADCAEEAIVAIRAHLESATHPAPPHDDREQVLAGLWRLAELDAFDLAVAEQRLLENEKLLRAMAGYAFIKMTPRTKPKSLFAALLKFSRRVKENTA